jgi:hypothetical protein
VLCRSTTPPHKNLISLIFAISEENGDHVYRFAPIGKL